jgi:hypothetical protein
MRKLGVVVAFWLLFALAPGAYGHSGGTGARELRSYIARMGPPIRDYRTALARADSAFERVSDSVAIQRLERSRRDFRRLASRVAAIRAPRQLSRQHRNLVTAVQTVSKAFGSFASARRQYLKDKDPGALFDRNARAQQSLKRAEPLQFGWARSVRARASSARVPIPAWLRNFAPGS